MNHTIIIAIGAFLVTVVVANIVTGVHDGLQGDLANRQKRKSSGMQDGNRLLLILLFPITLYVILGTLLFFLLYAIEVSAKQLRRYAGVDNPEAIPWHQVSVVLTLLFPAAFPIVALMVGLVFIDAIFSVIKKIARSFLRAIRRIWISIIHALHAFLDWLIDGIHLIWEMIADGAQRNWELIAGKIRLVFEQLSTLVQATWAAINDKTQT